MTLSGSSAYLKSKRGLGADSEENSEDETSERVTNTPKNKNMKIFMNQTKKTRDTMSDQIYSPEKSKESKPLIGFFNYFFG